MENSTIIGLIILAIIVLASIGYGVGTYVDYLEKQERSKKIEIEHKLWQQKKLDEAKLNAMKKMSKSPAPEIVPVENQPIMSDDEIAQTNVTDNEIAHVNVNTEVPEIPKNETNKVPNFLKKIIEKNKNSNKKKMDKQTFLKLIKNKK